MKSKEELAENYCNKIYQECVDEAMYVPDVYQSKKDFIAGFEAGESANPQNVFHFNLGTSFQKKRVIDKINGLKSKLKQETQPKLTKHYNTELIEKLKNQIEVLEKLLN